MSYFSSFLAIEYHANDVVLAALVFIHSGIVFTIIPITYEVLMSRLSPYYLVTINVCITMGAQITSMLIV